MTETVQPSREPGVEAGLSAPRRPPRRGPRFDLDLLAGPRGPAVADKAAMEAPRRGRSGPDLPEAGGGDALPAPPLPPARPVADADVSQAAGLAEAALPPAAGPRGDAREPQAPREARVEAGRGEGRRETGRETAPVGGAGPPEPGQQADSPAPVQAGVAVAKPHIAPMPLTNPGDGAEAAAPHPSALQAAAPTRSAEPGAPRAAPAGPEPVRGAEPRALRAPAAPAPDARPAAPQPTLADVRIAPGAGHAIDVSIATASVGLRARLVAGEPALRQALQTVGTELDRFGVDLVGGMAQASAGQEAAMSDRGEADTRGAGSEPDLRAFSDVIDTGPETGPETWRETGRETGRDALDLDALAAAAPDQAAIPGAADLQEAEPFAPGAGGNWGGGSADPGRRNPAELAFRLSLAGARDAGTPAAPPSSVQPSSHRIDRYA